MIRKITLVLAGLLSISLVYAMEKNTINLDKEFWGKWSILNQKASCIESYEFKKPGTFTYEGNQKKLHGEFAVIRSQDNLKLDILSLVVKNDNGLLGCGGDKMNYSNQKSAFSLKWITKKSAEICLDPDAKQCIGIFLNKQ